MMDKIGLWLLRLVTRNKKATILSPIELRLALISEQNGTPVVDWENVFVCDVHGNLYPALGAKEGRK
jgi:hypothetical protein